MSVGLLLRTLAAHLHMRDARASQSPANLAAALQARLHELVQAEEGLAAAQAAFNQAQASLKAMAAAAQQYKK